MAFAIDEINRNSKLLPNVTLGYSIYDNCVKLSIGFRAALSLISGQDEKILLSETCKGGPPVLAIVGDSSSTRSIAISTVLGLYRVPMVSFLHNYFKINVNSNTNSSVISAVTLTCERSNKSFKWF